MSYNKYGQALNPLGIAYEDVFTCDCGIQHVIGDICPDCSRPSDSDEDEDSESKEEPAALHPQLHSFIYKITRIYFKANIILIGSSAVIVV